MLCRVVRLCRRCVVDVGTRLYCVIRPVRLSRAQLAIRAGNMSISLRSRVIFAPMAARAERTPQAALALHEACPLALRGTAKKIALSAARFTKRTFNTMNEMRIPCASLGSAREVLCRHQVNRWRSRCAKRRHPWTGSRGSLARHTQPTLPRDADAACKARIGSGFFRFVL